MNKGDLLEYIDFAFKNGTGKVQLENLKRFMEYINFNEITSLKKEDADELIKKSKKLSKMIGSILELKDNSLLDNEVIFSLVLSYTNINNIELKLDYDDEEIINEEEELLESFEEEDKISSTTNKKNTNDIVNDFISELDSKLLTREEEIELAKRIEEGDEDAYQQMVYYNLRLVISVAKKYIKKGTIGFEDLIQEGNIGLMKAASKYDYRRGCRFSTYATWWIRQSIQRFVHEQSKSIRLPAHFAENISKMLKRERKLTVELGREPSDEELAESLGIKVEEVRYLKLVDQDVVSFSTPIGEDEDSMLGDFIPSEENYENDVIKEMFSDDVRELVFEKSNLTDKEKMVLKLRFGIDDDHPRTLDYIGKKLGVTRERVRQIEAKAIRKLRKNTGIKKLNDNQSKNKEKNNRKSRSYDEYSVLSRYSYKIPEENKNYFFTSPSDKISYNDEEWYYKYRKLK